jgi:hypothetical protein
MHRGLIVLHPFLRYADVELCLLLLKIMSDIFSYRRNECCHGHTFKNVKANAIQEYFVGRN